MTTPEPVIPARLLLAAGALTLTAYTGIVFLLPPALLGVFTGIAEEITDRIVSAAIDAFPFPEAPAEEAS